MSAERSSSEGVTLVRRFLISWVSLVCRFPKTVLVVCLALVVLSTYAACTRLNYLTQRTDLVSPSKEYQQRWQRYLDEFGDDDDIVVVVRGQQRAQMTRAIEALAERVKQHPERLDRLFYKVDLRPLYSRALLFLPTEKIRQIRDHVDSMRPLLALAPISWQQLGLSTLLQEGNGRARKLHEGKPLSVENVEFFARLKAILASASTFLTHPEGYRNPWSVGGAPAPAEDSAAQQERLTTPQYFFSADGTLAFLLARPTKEEGSFTAARQSVELVRRIVDDTSREFPDLEFGVTGMPVLETDEMVAAEKDTRLAFWLALAGVSLLYFLVYRRLAYPLLTVGTLLVGTAWAMGFTAITVGHLNILSATFAIMLIGMGDYGVLWVMRYEQARTQGLEVRAALLHTTEYVAVGNLTAACTLALAFFAGLFADFRAVAELGWIVGCGVLLCAFACFTVLPATLLLCDRRQIVPQANPEPTQGGGSAQADVWLPWLRRCPRAVATLGIVVTALLAVGATRIHYDNNLLHLQPANLDSVKWEHILIEKMAGTSWHTLSITESPREARALKKRYEQLADVSQVVEVASLVPQQQEAKLPLLHQIQQRLKVGLPERGAPIPHARPDVAKVRQQLQRLRGRLQARESKGKGPTDAPRLAFQPGLVEEIDRLQQMLRDADPQECAGRIQCLDERLAQNLAEDLHRLRSVSHPVAITRDDLPGPLRERYVSPGGKWLLRVFARGSLWEFPALEKFVEDIETVDPEATGKPFGTVKGLKAMQHGLTRAGIYAFVVIVLVLLLDFRSVGKAMVAIAPLVLAVVLTLGVLGWLGLPLNPANMIAFPLILGVGVDNGVHVLHDYLVRRQAGNNGMRGGMAESTISYAIGRGVLVKSLTAIVGFATLMLSTQRGLASLGFILAVGVGASLVSALLLLPAVLHLWAGRKRTEHATVSALPFPVAHEEETHRRAA